MKRYRLVDELYLDWIFSCINRGKIDNMVGREKDVIGREKGKS